MLFFLLSTSAYGQDFGKAPLGSASPGVPQSYHFFEVLQPHLGLIEQSVVLIAVPEQYLRTSPAQHPLFVIEPHPPPTHSPVVVLQVVGETQVPQVAPQPSGPHCLPRHCGAHVVQ